MRPEDIDTERGDEEIVFVSLPEIDTSEIIEENEDPRAELEELLEDRGLEFDGKIAAIFRDEISLHLEENSELRLNGEPVIDG